MEKGGLIMSDMKQNEVEVNEVKENTSTVEETTTEVVESTTNETVVNEEKPTEPTKKKSMLGKVLIIIAIIALILLLLTQCGKNEDETSDGTPGGNTSAIVDGELDLMDYEEIKAGLQAKVDDSYMNLKINLNPVFEGLDGKGNLFIQNTSTNRSNIQVHITLEETGELVYVSPVLKPNQSISEDTLTNTENVTTGSHKALAMFSIINPETGEKTSETGIKINLTIQ